MKVRYFRACAACCLLLLAALIMLGAAADASPGAVSNGGFEKGPDGSWEEYSLQGWPIIVTNETLPATAHGGTWAAWLGGDADEQSVISQRVTIPAGASALQYWNWIQSEDGCGFDVAGVVIDGVIEQVFYLCTESNTEGWVLNEVDLSVSAGKTVLLSFFAETDSTLNSNFFVDDVSIKEGPVATPEPTTQPGPELKKGAYLPVLLNDFSGLDECRSDQGVPRDYFPINSPFTTQPVVLDGRISSPAEWSNAFCVDLRMHEGIDAGSTNVKMMRWWIQNDGQYIYYLARMPQTPPATGVAVDYFWPEYSGTWPHSDGLHASTSGQSSDWANWDESQWYDDTELSPPGSDNVDAAVVTSGGYVWFEIRKELDSGDQWDWSVAPGDTVGGNGDSFLFAYLFEYEYYTRSAELNLGEP